MELYLKILKGARKDDIFKIAEGLTLGRSRADLNLKDSKASSIHAEIRSEDGNLVLYDNDSTNGSFLNGEKIDKIILKPGVVFKIGSTEMEVISDLALKKSSNVELSEWRETLYFQLSKMQTSQQIKKIIPFNKILKIKIESGILKGEEFILGYGPRLVGGGDSDIIIPGESEPLVKIEISKTGAPLFKDQLGHGIMVAGKSFSEVEIVDPISVQCGEIVLNVSILDETNS